MDAILSSDEYTNLFDILQQLGVEVVAAGRFVNALKRRPTTFIELFGQGRIVQAAAHGCRRAWNCEGLAALDLRALKPSGEPWDFSKQEDRDLAERMVDEKEPDWRIGSPPCTAFCSFSWGLNFPRMPKEKVDRILDETRQHLRFMIRLYWKQLGKGRHVLHEHRQSAQSWADEEKAKLLSDERVNTTVSDQCEYGLVTPGKHGVPVPARKPTRWASSSQHMLKISSA